jgi:hypothetical protein
MAAALNVELEAFALKDEHDAPPQQDERTKHHGHGAGTGQCFHSRRGTARRDEIGGSVGLHMVAQPLLDDGGRAAVTAGEIASLAVIGQVFVFSACGRRVGFTFPQPPGAHRLHILDGQVELAVDDNFAVGLDAHSLRGIDGHQEHKARARVQYGHEEDGDGDAEKTPVGGGLLAGALGEQLALPASAAVRAPARRAEQHPDRSPEADWRLRGEDHDCAGRVVSRRKMSSSVSPACWPCCARSSPIEPLATTVPSLMITAWEQRRVTWSIRCVENRTVTPSRAVAEMRS